MYAYTAMYLYLIEQGKTHDQAVAHVMQRFGAPRAAVLDELERAYEDHRKKADVLFIAVLDRAPATELAL